MKKSLLRVNKSTAKRAHIILLLPFIVSMVNLKIFFTTIILAAVFCAAAFLIHVVCKKYFSIIVAYPIFITIIGMLTVSLSRVPDLLGFSISSALIPAAFFSLFIYKYVGAVRETNKLRIVINKFATISIGTLILSIICEFASNGTLFDIKIHNYPIAYFCTYSGVLFILALIAAFINLTTSHKFNINKSFCMKKGSIRLISYSAFTALVVFTVSVLINNYILVPVGISYIQPIVVCFTCGLSFIAYRLIDKKLHIGKHAANFIPSMTLLFTVSVESHSSSYTDMLISHVLTYIIIMVSVYLCEIMTKRKNVPIITNPFAGAPATLLMFSVAILILDKISQFIPI